MQLAGFLTPAQHTLACMEDWTPGMEQSGVFMHSVFGHFTAAGFVLIGLATLVEQCQYAQVSAALA